MEATISPVRSRGKRISKTGRVARENKWVIEVLDPELQEQCKSYKDGKKILNDETDA